MNSVACSLLLVLRAALVYPDALDANRASRTSSSVPPAVLMSTMTGCSHEAADCSLGGRVKREDVMLRAMTPIDWRGYSVPRLGGIFSTESNAPTYAKQQPSVMSTLYLVLKPQSDRAALATMASFCSSLINPAARKASATCATRETYCP